MFKEGVASIITSIIIALIAIGLAISMLQILNNIKVFMLEKQKMYIKTHQHSTGIYVEKIITNSTGMYIRLKTDINIYNITCIKHSKIEQILKCEFNCNSTLGYRECIIKIPELNRETLDNKTSIELIILDNYGNVYRQYVTCNCSEIPIKFFEVYPRIINVRLKQWHFISDVVPVNFSYSILLRTLSEKVSYLQNISVYILDTTSNTPLNCNILNTTIQIRHYVNHTNITINPTWVNTTYITCELKPGVYTQHVKVLANGTCKIDEDTIKIKQVLCLRDFPIWQDPSHKVVCTYFQFQLLDWLKYWLGEEISEFLEKFLRTWICVNCQNEECRWNLNLSLPLSLKLSCYCENNPIGYVVSTQEGNYYMNVTYCKLRCQLLREDRTILKEYWNVSAAVILVWDVRNYPIVGNISIYADVTYPTKNRTGVLIFNQTDISNIYQYIELYNEYEPAFKQSHGVYNLTTQPRFLTFLTNVSLPGPVYLSDSPEYIGIYVEADPGEYSEATWYDICFIPAG